MNKYRPHVYVIPEDDADRQIADGFVLHHQVQIARIMVVPPAGGWRHVLETFEKEYISILQQYPAAHVVMLIDFDDKVDTRRPQFEKAIPGDVKPRVFVVGSKDDPERFKIELNRPFENIGLSLASDCDTGAPGCWGCDQLIHNDAERQRLVQVVKPFLF